MEIIKRTGKTETYDGQKIINAITKAFKSTGRDVPQTTLRALLTSVEEKLDRETVKSVEKIQDLVEQALMESLFFAEAKSYILFRQKRSEFRAARKELCALIRVDSGEGETPLEKVFSGIQKSYQDESYSLKTLSAKYVSFSKENMNESERLAALIRAASELVSPEAPKWEFIAGRLLNYSFRHRLRADTERLGLKSFYDKLEYLTEAGMYGSYILKSYTKAEIEEAAAFIVPERDDLFTYSGLDLLLKRYVIRTGKHVPLETPQEMFLGIALHLAMNEPAERMNWVRRFYDMLSRMEVTMATPTLANARKPYHQLSSCFVDTVPDSLNGIYRSIDNFAKVSKFGGGMGMYFGKVRAAGSAIRGFEGAAGGIIRWIRLVNDTAVAVDQLGVRAGAVAVYLDAWHRDLPEFLNIRTNNGDDRMKAHDVFPGVCYPDLFWKMAKENLDQDWYLMCPHEICTVKGYHLEDFWGEEWEKRYADCVHDNRIAKRAVSVKDIVRLVLKSAVETGTPFVFNRDTVNRANPNAHRGMIYCSNLCTEIAQNMSGIESVSTQITVQNGETVVVHTTKPGSFVVCNLASLSLGNLPLEDTAYLQSVVRTAVRALDNVIDLNFYPVPYAEITNRAYRPIGLGVSGWHHALAKRAIKWESDEHLAFADRVFETINRAAVEASSDNAAEKGAYSCFDGSDWQTGAYFAKRGYDSAEWRALAQKVRAQGMRNAYLLAVAPTSSTSIIAGTTPGIDPVMKRWFLEEKKGYMLTRTAPELGPETWWYYKNAHQIDQKWSIRSCGIRQRHIDQAQSMNLYITNEYTMRQVLDLYLLAWECGVKSVYYVRSKSLEVEECESCAS
ncbi:ribonucleoside-diphosphate reductase subunit alpha [Treponema brennaborense]|uniref:Ribonucleoside-diphosphate reductase n=1 Tax=Treponema brennaborense (strain DSM 12168 / CIP 105900 / DD5/3) TaxID=906968 RepID=F4LN31_TREBD|nr:ribonucleoside-diphosphate reductase subunit alpha [Treponema brennaborense]AEE15817.1 ribonucleoside-diphosphate reductase, alpha subunit [Treponema brennaborense DSM 12168]